MIYPRYTVLYTYKGSQKELLIMAFTNLKEALAFYDDECKQHYLTVLYECDNNYGGYSKVRSNKEVSNEIY